MKKPLFFDIETCRKTDLFAELPEREQFLFVKRHKSKIDHLLQKISHDSYVSANAIIESHESSVVKELQDLYEAYAPLDAEYATVVSIVCGVIMNDEIRLITSDDLVSFDEREILLKFSNTLEKMKNLSFCLCGWNIINFDIPFLFKRMIINKIPVPPILSMYGKKPWDVQDKVYDLQHAWTNGSYGINASMDSVASALGVESSKNDEIVGATVSNYIFRSNDSVLDKVKKINDYCAKDVVCTAKIYNILKEFA